MAWNAEVPNPALLFREISLTQKSHGEIVLNHSVHIMNEHISLTLLSIPSHKASRVNGAHSSRCLIEVTCWSIHHYQVPFHLINLAWKPFKCKLTLAKSGVSHNLAFFSHSYLHQLIRLMDLGVVLHMIRLQVGQPLLNLVDPCFIFFKENRAAAVVESRPHEAVMAQSEHQEVAGRLSFQDSGGHRDLLEGLLRGYVGGCVMNESIGHRRRGFCANWKRWAFWFIGQNMGLGDRGWIILGRLKT
uniref:Uncharacterized protein n=1 Tax=Cucumis sativus TaxID=3659 RepID=A0A0A0LPY0_CUCSA